MYADLDVSAARVPVPNTLMSCSPERMVTSSRTFDSPSLLCLERLNISLGRSGAVAVVEACRRTANDASDTAREATLDDIHAKLSRGRPAREIFVLAYTSIVCFEAHRAESFSIILVAGHHGAARNRIDGLS